MHTKFYSNCDEIAALITSGGSLALFKNAISYSFGAHLLKSRATNLHVITVPTGGLLIDLLIKYKKVGHIETSGISLGEDGPAPQFTEALNGTNLNESRQSEKAIKITDATCPAIYAGLQAAEKGIPFMPIRGLIGSDIVKKRKELKIIKNPYKENDLIVCIPPIAPDFTVFHVSLADVHGNVFIASDPELKLLAHASKKTLVTTDLIVQDNLLEKADYKNNTLSNFYIDAIVKTNEINDPSLLEPFV